MATTNNELELTSLTGEYSVARARADVEYLGSRDLKISRFPRGHSHDKDMRHFVGIDPMSFVLETPEEQMAAYAFSQLWVGRVRII